MKVRIFHINQNKLSNCRKYSLRHCLQLAAYALAMINSSVAFAKYGDVMQIKGNSPFPPGWVVIDVTAQSMATTSTGIASALSVSTLTFTIRDMNGAKYGDVVHVRGNSPIPMGWVIIETLWPTTYSTGLGNSIPDHIAVHTLKYLIADRSQEDTKVVP
jgi:hypothetical protein